MIKPEFKPKDFICSRETFLEAEKIVKEGIEGSYPEQIHKVMQGIRYFCRELGVEEYSDNLLQELYKKLRDSNNFEYFGIAEKVREIVGFEDKIKTIGDIAGFLRENFDKILDVWAEKEEIVEIFEKKAIDRGVFKEYFGKQIINYFIVYIEGNGKVGNCPYVQKLIEFFKEKKLSIEDINNLCNFFRFSVQDVINEEYGDLADFKLYREVDGVMLQNLNGVLHSFTVELFKLKLIVDEVVKEGGVIIQTIDLDGYVKDVSENCEVINGYTREELIGLKTSKFRSGVHDNDFYEDLRTTIKSGKTWTGKLFNRRKDGSTFSMKKTIIPIKDEDGKITGFIDIGFDITAEEEKTNVDDLTGLYNRKKYREDIATEINRIERSNEKLSLLFMDLDDFKQINDSYGHIVGDEVLQLLSGILMENKRLSDRVYRLGGEEFVVIVPDTDMEGAVVFAEKIRKSIEETCLDKGRFQVKPTISIGVSEYMVGDGDSAEYFLERADSAMYNAKAHGKNMVCFIPKREDIKTD